MAESRGMLIVRSNDASILFRATLFDAANAKITSGTTNLRIWHYIPTSGALETYDFNDNTFKTGAVTTATTTMTHRQAENSTYNTGLWTYRHTNLTSFVAGDKYIGEVSHSSLPRPIQVEFQYGDLEGDEALWTAIRERETAQAGAAGTITLNTNASTIDNFYNGHVVMILSGAGAGQARVILSYVGSTRVATLKRNWVTTPDSTSQYIIIPLDVDSIVDEIWDEDIVAAHGTAATSGFLLRVLGSAISTRSFNNNLNALLGVPDTSVNDTVTGDVWEELFASHNNASTMGRIMNNINTAGPPSAATIASAVWDENIVASHGTASTSGFLLRVLGAAISTRTNNATLNALLGVPDTAGVDLVDTVWNEDIVAAHGTAATAGLLLRVLGSAISTRTNNATLNALLGVPDTAGADVPGQTTDEVWDEVLSAATHDIADSAGKRLRLIDDLTEAGAAGDLADIRTQVRKIDKTANDSPAAAGSLAKKLDDIASTLNTFRAMVVSINIQGSAIRVEAGIEKLGVMETTPWVQCSAQIFDELNAIVTTIGVADFGAIGTRGFFARTVTPHLLVAGKTYQIRVTITDGAALSFTTTKVFKVLSV